MKTMQADLLSTPHLHFYVCSAKHFWILLRVKKITTANQLLQLVFLKQLGALLVNWINKMR